MFFVVSVEPTDIAVISPDTEIVIMTDHKFDHSIIEVETFDLFTYEERKKASKWVKKK